MQYDEKFIDKLKKSAKDAEMHIDDCWIKENCTPELCSFLKDFISQKIKEYTHTDWDRVCEEAKENITYQNLFFARYVPKRVFVQFANTMDAEYALQRDDLLPAEIQQQIDRLTDDKLYDFIKHEHGRISARVINYLATMPVEKLSRIDFIPLQFIYKDLPCFNHIQENFPELYEYDERAMTAIVNNAHMGKEARIKAFDVGCDIFSIKEPSQDIVHKIYESSIETLTTYQDSAHERYKTAIQTMLSKMIQEDVLPSSCQIDLAQRINNDETCESCSGWLTRALALHSKYDEVTAVISAPFRREVMELVAQNTNAGAETYNLIDERIDDANARKSWLICFLSHKKVLYDNALIDGFNAEDHELCKILSAFYGNNIFNNIKKPIQEDYRFYHDFANMTRLLYAGNDRCDSVIKLMLESNYEQPINNIGAGRIDATGSVFISYNVFKEILREIEPLCCITEVEASNIKTICSELRKKYKNPNLQKHIKNFETKLKEIIKTEEFRRQNENFFYKKRDMDYNKGDEYHFNIIHMLRTNDDEINKLIKNIKKINDIKIIKTLKENLVSNSVESVTSEGAHSWILIANKFSPIYQALEDREKRLEHPFGKMMDGFSKAVHDSINR